MRAYWEFLTAGLLGRLGLERRSRPRLGYQAIASDAERLQDLYRFLTATLCSLSTCFRSFNSVSRLTFFSFCRSAVEQDANIRGTNKQRSFLPLARVVQFSPPPSPRRARYSSSRASTEAFAYGAYLDACRVRAMVTIEWRIDARPRRLRPLRLPADFF